MGAGSTINWAAVSNQNLAYNPAYSLADTANTRANRALSDASDAYDMADAAFARANQAYRMADSIEMPSYIRSTYIDSTTIRSPVIEGGEFYGGEFNVIAGGNSGSFNLYGLMEAVASICLASAIMTRAYGGRISMFPALAVGLSALMVMLSLPETLSSPALMFTALARIRRITYEEKTENTLRWLRC